MHLRQSDRQNDSLLSTYEVAGSNRGKSDDTFRRVTRAERQQHVAVGSSGLVSTDTDLQTSDAQQQLFAHFLTHSRVFESA